MGLRRDEIDIQTRDGIAHAWIYRGGAAPEPAVLLYPDAGGVRSAMHAMAGRLAGLGYLVLLPNVYYRESEMPTIDMGAVWSDPAGRDRVMQLIQSLTPERVGTDAAAY